MDQRMQIYSNDSSFQLKLNSWNGGSLSVILLATAPSFFNPHPCLLGVVGEQK